MSNLLSEDGKSSSMRFNFTLISIGVFVILLSVAFYIVVSATDNEMPEPAWTAIGGFCIGLATVVTGMGYNKVQQKKIEANGKKDG